MEKESTEGLELIETKTLFKGLTSKIYSIKKDKISLNIVGELLIV